MYVASVCVIIIWYVKHSFPVLKHLGNIANFDYNNNYLWASTNSQEVFLLAFPGLKANNLFKTQFYFYLILTKNITTHCRDFHFDVIIVNIIKIFDWWHLYQLHTMKYCRIICDSSEIVIILTWWNVPRLCPLTEKLPFSILRKEKYL